MHVPSACLKIRAGLLKVGPGMRRNFSKRFLRNVNKQKDLASVVDWDPAFRSSGRGQNVN